MEEQQPDVLELTRKLGREPNPRTALLIMQWELGDLAKSIVYMEWHPDLATSYKAEAKLAMASLLFQVQVIASLLDFDPGDLFNMGVETVKGRIKEMEKKIGRFKHYVGEEEHA